MQRATPLAVASEIKTDPQMIKQWAAEDFAISAGLLRECPYHGEPYKPHVKGGRFSARRIDPLDPAVRVFDGDTRELLAAVERVTRDYGDRCVFCAASDHEEDFD
jgi:hypothetical protein